MYIQKPKTVLAITVFECLFILVVAYVAFQITQDSIPKVLGSNPFSGLSPAEYAGFWKGILIIITGALLIGAFESTRQTIEKKNELVDQIFKLLRRREFARHAFHVWNDSGSIKPSLSSSALFVVQVPGHDKNWTYNIQADRVKRAVPPPGKRPRWISAYELERLYRYLLLSE